MLRLRLAAPSLLVDLGGIAELRGIREDGDGIVIGAMTPYYEIIGDNLVQEHVALLAQATRDGGRQPGAPPRHAGRRARARRPGR